MLDEIFGLYPNNIELYKLALLHRSASVFLENGAPINNERLEFLGDAILEAVVSDYLFIEFPDQDEGFMTQMRSKIVSRSSLNQLSIDIGLAGHVIYNSNGNHTQKNLNGDALEAIIGAMYLDKGYDFVNRLLINKIFRRYFDLSEITETEIDFKSRLIEWCQRSRRTIAFHTSSSPSSTAREPGFVSRVVIDGIDAGFGEGGSKKEAEQNASRMISGLMISDTQSDHILELTDDEPGLEIREQQPVKKGRRPARRKTTDDGPSQR